MKGIVFVKNLTLEVSPYPFLALRQAQGHFDSLFALRSETLSPLTLLGTLRSSKGEKGTEKHLLGAF